MPTYIVEIVERIEHLITIQAKNAETAKIEALKTRGLATESALPELVHVYVEKVET